MSYTYSVLSDNQIRLLDDYSGAMKKVKLSQIIDEVLAVTTTGNFTDVTVTDDVVVGDDLTVGGDATCDTLKVGGGYGSTGLSVDTNGNIITDGVGDFSIGGCKIRAQTPASAAAPGVAGTIVFDASYIYICIASNTWERAAINTW